MCYDKGNYEEFNKAISETEWENLLNPMDHINTYWTKFHDKGIRKKICTEQTGQTNDKKEKG